MDGCAHIPRARGPDSSLGMIQEGPGVPLNRGLSLTHAG